MSKIPPLQCLFCNHRNLAGARYCNDCASPLHLQPCNQCGAIDKRNAKNCYKCGAQFAVPAAPKVARAPAAPKLAPVPAASKLARVPAAPKLAPVPAAPELAAVPAAPELAVVPAAPELAAVPAAAARESMPAPPILENQLAKPILNDGGVAIERAFLSESPAQVVSVFRQGLRREVTETQGQAAGVADREPTHLNPDPAHSYVEPQPMDETVASESVQDPDPAHSAVELQSMDEAIESERAMTATGSRRARRLAVLTLLLAATAIAGYFYDRSEQQLAQSQSAGQPSPSAPDGPISAGATPATVATQANATPAPKDSRPQLTTGTEEVEKALSPAAPVVAKPRTDPVPVPANRPLDDPASVNRPAAAPQAAGATMSVRSLSAIDAGVKTRQGSPVFKECTEAVAALGFCSQSKQQGEK